MADRVTKVTLTAQVAGYIDGMDKAAKKTREVGSAAAELAQKEKDFQAMGKGMLFAGTAVLALGAAAAKTGIDYNALQQSSRAALTTLLGSAEAANAQMDRLDDFARTSPFAKSTFITAQQQMLAFGIEAKKVVPYLDAIQNAVAAAGGSNADIEGIVATMSKIQSSAKITAEDLNEFGNRGVNAAGLIGAQMGKTGGQIRQEITNGSLGASAALDALVAGMSEKFDGAADNVKNTWDGATDRLKAAWRDFSSELAKPLVDPNGGGALVDLLNWTSDAMRNFQALPEPVKAFTSVVVLGGGAVTALGGAALLAAPKIVAAKAALESFGISGGGLVGRLGGVTAALGVAGVAFGIWAQKQAEAKARTDEFTSALEASNGAIDENVRKVAAKQLQDKGVFDSAKALGISLEDLTNAAVGEADALKRVNAVLTEFRDKNAESGFESSTFAEMLLRVEDAVGTTADSLDDGSDSWQSQSEATGVAGEAYADTAGKAAELQSNIEALTEAVNAANGVGQDAVSANAAYQEALEKVRETVAEAQAGADGYSTTLDESTAAGAANAAMFAELAGKSQDAALAQFELDGNTQNYTAALGVGRQALYDQILALTGNADAAQALTDKIYAMPSEKEIEIIAETQAAQDALDTFVGRNQGRTISMFVATNGADASFADVFTKPNANGGMYSYASGGIAEGIYSGGAPLYKFAEEQTGWEAFISGRPGQEARNRGIALDAYERLGGYVGGPQQQAAAPVVYVQNPWTGEYMEARFSETAGKVVTQYEKQTSRATQRGSTGF